MTQDELENRYAESRAEERRLRRELIHCARARNRAEAGIARHREYKKQHRELVRAHRLLVLEYKALADKIAQQPQVNVVLPPVYKLTLPATAHSGGGLGLPDA